VALTAGDGTRDTWHVHDLDQRRHTGIDQRQPVGVGVGVGPDRAAREAFKYIQG